MVSSSKLAHKHTRKRKECTRTVGMGGIRKAPKLIFAPPKLEAETNKFSVPSCSHS
jgi:hypothetical protein